jgi:formylglycine-generating enzyme required for sulfatase activity
VRKGTGPLAAIAALALAAPAGAAKCPQDSVQVGGLCVDKYEASVWEIPAGSSKLVKKVEKGKIASAAQLGGAIQRGAVADDYGPGCPDDASTACAGFYAVSIPGVIPARYVNWFQAVAVCANAGKRLLTNLEWQVASFGTPDTGGDDDGSATCNTDNLGPQVLPTGSRSACVSARGAFDMAGNVWEWVEDYYAGDYYTTGPTSDPPGPASGSHRVFRGGGFGYPEEDIAVYEREDGEPTTQIDKIGFRCAR